MYATVTNTKNKGSSLPMALRAVATERAVSSSSTALRRGELRSGPSIEVQAFKFSAKVSVRNKQPFSSNGQHLNRNHDKVVNHNHQTVLSQPQQRAILTGGWVWKILKLRLQSTIRPNCTSVLANPSLNRTLCGGPRLAIISFLAKHGPPQSAA